MKKRSLSWLLAGLILLVLLYPEKLTIVPEYHVKVIDQSGQPMERAAVSELWQLVSVQRQEMLEQRYTNASGEVVLPARTIRAPLAERALGCLAHWGREGFDSPCGRRFTISGSGDLKELERTETTTGILKRQHSLVIKLQHCDMREPLLC
jgi:hypothetical protein